MIETVTQLLIPSDLDDAYQVWDLTSMIVAEQGLSIPPLNYLTQRGSYQHGDTVVGMRAEPRTIQLVMSKEFNSLLDYQLSRDAWIAKLSPINTGDLLAPVRPYVYRKILLRRYRVDLADLVITAGSPQVTSASAKFVQQGLAAGMPFTIDDGLEAGGYFVVSVENENTVTLTNLAWAPGVYFANSETDRCHYWTGAVTRDIDVFVDDAPRLDVLNTRFTRSRREALRLVAHDPIWRDAFQQTISWAVDISGNLIFYESPDWTDRAVFPIWFSGDFVVSDVILTYAGTWPTRPVITLHGPFSLFKLTNNSTGDVLILNYAAVQGEVITIDLYALDVTNQAGVNLTNYLYNSGTQDSDLVTFQLAPHPIVLNGLNSLSIEMNDAQPLTTRATMTWQSRYIGV